MRANAQHLVNTLNLLVNVAKVMCVEYVLHNQIYQFVFVVDTNVIQSELNLHMYILERAELFVMHSDRFNAWGRVHVLPKRATLQSCSHTVAAQHTL